MKEPLRVCKVCGLKAYTEEDLEQFYKHKNSKHGRVLLCKSCGAKKQREYQNPLLSRGDEIYEGREKETKKCSNCKRVLPLSHFHRRKGSLDGYNVKCVDCTTEYKFLYGRRERQGSYFDGTGICLVCGEVNPLVLHNHHIYGRKNSEVTITTCTNCHTLLRYFPQTLYETFFGYGRMSQNGKNEETE